MLQPKMAMKVMSGDGQATMEDAAKGIVTAAVDKAKDSVLTRANEKLDEAKTTRQARALPGRQVPTDDALDPLGCQRFGVVVALLRVSLLDQNETSLRFRLLV